MVVDIHYHFRGPLEGSALADRARVMARYYGAEGRNGLPLTAAQILERLRSLRAPDPDGSRLLQRMDEAGIDLTVILMVDEWKELADEAAVLEANRACAQWVKQHPDRLIAFAGVDPRRQKAPDLLRRCIEDYGMRGLKLHPGEGFGLTSPEAYALLGEAQELGVPVVTHTGPLAPPWRSTYFHPQAVDDVCLDFPSLQVVAAHMGRNWWATWAGLAQYRHNLFGDLAMWQYLAAQNYPRFCQLFREILDWCSADAVLFGTDAPNIEAVVPNKQFVQAIRDLPSQAPPGIAFTEAEVEAILAGNARRLLRL